ncbi:MAG: cytochrome b N-terminal domain-containing protein [Desulfobulbaceae bacterium]|jgi:ubiquinol-cytochrome c reductase cytochrome b subunit|nr:cytochrome b N-terminal domain-containing protein [Desulfobulbaceae bacterium]
MASENKNEKGNTWLKNSLFRLRALPFGAMALISLYVSLASGIVVALQYQAENAYQSVVMLDQLAPGGAFARSLHFYSSQVFFLLLIGHFVAVFTHIHEMDRGEYWRLAATLPLSVLLLFTGYVLRDDRTGAAAGRIAESIILTIPFIGNSLGDLFVAIATHGLGRIFLHHMVTLGLILLLLVWRHLHRYRVQSGDYLWLIGGMALFCAVVAAPLDATSPSSLLISGPWFFLGIQEALRYAPTFVAGIGFPAVLLAALACLAGAHRRAACACACIWLCAYALLSIMAIWR